MGLRRWTDAGPEGLLQQAGRRPTSVVGGGAVILVKHNHATATPSTCFVVFLFSSSGSHFFSVVTKMARSSCSEMGLSVPVPVRW